MDNSDPIPDDIPTLTAAPAPSAAPIAPTARGDRIVALDALRGFALLGIVLVNAPSFALPITSAMAPPTPGNPLDRACWLLVHLLCEQRFIALFAVLFGAGFALQSDRAAARGEPHWPLWLRRVGVLALVGLAHGLLIWWGDILFVYACLGFVLLAFGRCQARTLLLWGVGLLTVYVLWIVGLAAFLDDVTSTRTPAQAPPTLEPGWHRGAEAILHSDGDIESPRWRAAEAAAFRDGPWLDALAFRAVNFAIMLFVVAIGPGVRVLGLFVLGAGLMRAGYFAHPTLPRRFAVVGFGLGVPLAAAEGLILTTHGWGLVPLPTALAVATSACAELGSLALAAGYLGAVTLVARAAPQAVAPLATIGRMALTVYIGQSVCLLALTSWWGLGWYGSLGSAQLTAAAVGVYLVLWLFCLAWQRAFVIGPLEWCWRALSYGALPPLRRPTSSSPPSCTS